MASNGVVAFVFILLLFGCATNPRVNVKVDSLASHETQEKLNYIMLSGNKDATPNDLQFQEFAAYLARALDSRGFVYAQNSEDADLAILLSYGIGEPQTNNYTYSLPVWGQTGVSSAYTYGTASAYGNTATYSGTTTYEPTYGITGYTTHTGSKTTYFRYVVITGYDYEVFKETDKEIQLWQTKITSVGESGDLRQVFPILIGAAVPYIAKNTGKKVPVTLYESDNIVKVVKGELSEANNQSQQHLPNNGPFFGSNDE
jgi:hypothetical protein